MAAASSRSSLLCLLGVLALGACGNDSAPTPTPAKQVPAGKADDGKEAPKVVDVGSPTPAEGGDEPDMLDGDSWGDEGVAPDEPDSGEPPVLPEEGGEPPEADAGDEPHPGPCKITWSTGAVLSFKYEDGGGKVRIDEDGNGKPETCGSFKTADGKTTSIEVDAGCNGTAETQIAPEYDPKSNVATAVVTEGEGDAQTKQTLTMVTMPSFTGLTPGYAMYADRKASGVYVRSGLARTANVKKPSQGEPVKVTFGYDKKKRLVRVKEDFGADGSQDRRFDYRYDDLGNVTGMSVVIGSGDAQQKGYARLSYTCFDK